MKDNFSAVMEFYSNSDRLELGNFGAGVVNGV
jgi:hypothetical protein